MELYVTREVGSLFLLEPLITIFNISSIIVISCNRIFIMTHLIFWLACISNASLCNCKNIGPAVYKTFSTNHLSYTKTLVPIYRFRVINIFWWCCNFFGKKWPFFIPPPQKKIVGHHFSKILNCSSFISRYMLGHILSFD